MTKAEVEVFSAPGNDVVIRMPGRRYPGVLVQGDSLSILVNLAASIDARAKKLGDEDLVDDSTELRELLMKKLQWYEAALKAHGIDLPYSR